MTQLYYDNFADKVVTEIDNIAPPERYIKVHCGSDIFIEKWFVGLSDNKHWKGKYLNIAYTPFDRENGFVHSIRRTIEKNHNAQLQYMTDWTVTAEHYKKMESSLGE